jgi:hypothetical protein
VVGPWGQRAALSTGQLVGFRPPCAGPPLGLAQIVDVQVAVRLEPVLVHLDGECPDQPSTARGGGEDADDLGAPLALLIEALKEVGGLQVFVVLARQALKGQGLIDVLLDPAAQLGVGRLPFGEPGRKVAPGRGEGAPRASTIRYGQASSSRRPANWASSSSSQRLIALIAEAAKLWPQSAPLRADHRGRRWESGAR